MERNRFSDEKKGNPLYRIGRLFLLCLLLLTACLVPMTASAASDFGDRVAGMAEIRNVRVGNTADKTRIVIDADRTVSFKQFTLKNPDRVVIDIPNAWMAKGIKIPKASSRFVGGVRIAQHDPTTVRIVVENKVGSSNYKAFTLKKPMRVVLDFGNIGPDTSQATIAVPGVQKPQAQQPKPQEQKPKPQAQNQKPQPKPQAQKPKPQAQKPKPQTQTSSTKPAEEAAKDQPSQQPTAKDEDQTDEEIQNLTSLQGRKITIDPGHGGNDSGAIGPTGIMEKSITLRISNELRRLLVAQGAEVTMTRTTDTEVSPKHAKASDIEELQARCDVANQAGADVFVCIHMDSFSNGAAHGTTGYYYSLGSKKSRDLADKIRAGVIDQIGTASRGTQSANFYVLKHTDMPATLIEVAFISNPDEEKLLDTEAGVRKAAQGIADGIADYFG